MEIYPYYETDIKSDLSIYNSFNGSHDIDGVENTYEAFMVCPLDSVKSYAEPRLDLDWLLVSNIQHLASNPITLQSSTNYPHAPL